MDLKKYYKKVYEIEKLASEYPGKYKRRLVAIALFGIISLIIVIVLGIVLAVLTAMNRVIYPSILIILMELAIIKVLFYKSKPDDCAIKLSKRKFPELYRHINEVSRKINGPKVDHIFVNLDINAAVNQSLFRCNYLLIGYPLTLSMSHDQFLAVLAHELGHLSKDHSQTTNMIYRINQMWCNAASGGIIRSLLLFPFTEFYVPLLERYSLVLMKKHEIDADAVSVAYSGPGCTAQSLGLLYAYSSLLDKKFNDKITTVVERNPDVPAEFSICRLFENTIMDEISSEELQEELKKNMRCGAMPYDSHPALKTRFAHIGAPTNIALEKVSETAAKTLFAENYQLISDKLDDLYRKEVKKSWRSKHFYYQDCRKRLTELEVLKKDQELSEENYLEIIDVVATIDKNENALAIAEEAVSKYPENAAILFRYKGLMLEENDPRGEDILHEPHKNNLEQTYLFKDVIYDYLYRNGRIDELLEFISYIDENEDAAIQKLESSIETNPDGNYLPHNQSDGSLEPIIDIISKDKSIINAWLVKVDTSKNVGCPFFLLLLNLKTSSRYLEAQDKYLELFDEVDFPYMLRTQICFNHNELVKKISSIDGSQIWSR